MSDVRRRGKVPIQSLSQPDGSITYKLARKRRAASGPARGRSTGTIEVIRQRLLAGEELSSNQVMAELGCSASSLGYAVKTVGGQGYGLARRTEGQQVFYKLDTQVPARAAMPNGSELPPALADTPAVELPAPPLGAKLDVWMVMVERGELTVGLSDGTTRWVALLQGASPA